MRCIVVSRRTLQAAATADPVALEELPVADLTGLGLVDRHAVEHIHAALVQ
jgi:hypothetical protein